MYIAQKLRLGKYLGIFQLEWPNYALLNWHIGCNVIVWGIALTLQGATTNFGVFFALRFILGEI